jgi:hypothetical protein
MYVANVRADFPALVASPSLQASDDLMLEAQ